MFITESMRQAKKEIEAIERFAEHYSCMDEALAEMAKILRTARRREDDPETVDFPTSWDNVAAFREYLESFESTGDLERALKNLWQELKPAHEKNAALRDALDEAEHAVDAAVHAMEKVGPSAGGKIQDAVNDSIALPLGALWFNFLDARDILDASEDERGCRE